MGKPWAISGMDGQKPWLGGSLGGPKKRRTANSPHKARAAGDRPPRVPQKFPGLLRVALLSKGADLNTSAIASRDRYNPMPPDLPT